MRAETKQKLDALERAQKLRKALLVTIAGAVVLAGALLYTRPRTLIGTEMATVTRSVVGRDHWGQPFHDLTVRLKSGETRSVETFLVPKPLPIGQAVKLEKWQGFWGNAVFRVSQGHKQEPQQPLTPKSGGL